MARQGWLQRFGIVHQLKDKGLVWAGGNKALAEFRTQHPFTLLQPFISLLTAGKVDLDKLAKQLPEDPPRIRIEGTDAEALRLLRTAVESKVLHIRLGIEVTQARLHAFEQRYGMPSEEFIKKSTVEDLAGGDLDYVEWAGEWKILRQLREDLRRLEAIEYADR
jgi:hypothetical protein